MVSLDRLRLGAVSFWAGAPPTVRVLIALNTFEEDGPGLLVARVCERLAGRAGLQLHAVALSRGGPLEERLLAAGVKTHHAHSRGPGGLRNLRRWADGFAELHGGAHLIHTHLPWPDVAMRLVRRRLGNPPMLSTCHGMHAIHEKGWLRGAVWQFLERRTRRHCKAWIAVSVAVQHQLLEYGIDHWRTEVIPNGVDTEAFLPLDEVQKALARKRLDLPVHGRLIGCAGTLRSLKGQDTLIRAFAPVYRRHPDAALVLAGRGPLEPRLKRLADELRVSDRLLFIGHIPESDLPGFHGCLDLAVQPSRAEAFGMALCEAQACGVPVVASDVGGLREVVADGESGFLVPPGEHRALAAAMLKLLGDESMRLRMGAAGRERVQKLFPLDRTAERTYRTWCSLVE
jgi:glycosyltransferase involved in cell wall biosynthesis